MDLNELRNTLTYSPDTGLFHWLVSRGSKGSGFVAGYIETDGRPKVHLFGKRYIQSRLAYFYMTGAWPKEEVDHINRDVGDNRWCNLRAATRSENCRNMPALSRSKTGIKGVWFIAGRYRAEIMLHGKRHYLGRFKTKEAAQQAYRVAAEKLHGEFACVNALS